MLCERCRKKESTVHLTEVIKSVRSEVHLCEQCAREIGLNSKLNNYALSIPDMLSFMDEEPSELAQECSCSVCGTSGSDIETNGRAGCPNCYTSLRDYLEIAYPEFQNAYKGKHPAALQDREICSSAAECEEEKQTKLKIELEEAVREERYEDAARLRDALKEN
mgnify:CR=1 FL=1